MNVEVNCTDTEIEIAIGTENSTGNKRQYDITIAKEQGDDGVEYTAECVYTRDGYEPRTEFEISVVIDYEDCTVEISEGDDTILSGTYELDGDVLSIELEEESSSSTETTVTVVFIVDDEMPEIDTTKGEGIETLDYTEVKKFFNNFDDIFDIF